VYVYCFAGLPRPSEAGTPQSDSRAFARKPRPEPSIESLVWSIFARHRTVANNYSTEMCSGSEAGSYVRLMDAVYHLTLGLKVKKKDSHVQSCTGLVAHTVAYDPFINSQLASRNAL